jgi:hypothetical protein
MSEKKQQKRYVVVVAGYENKVNRSPVYINRANRGDADQAKNELEAVNKLKLTVVEL